MGKKKNIKAIKEVWEYRQKGLSFRVISRIMKKDLRQIYRWYQYKKEELEK